MGAPNGSIRQIVHCFSAPMEIFATLHNRTTVLRPADVRLKREFSYLVPGSWFSRAYREGRWDGRRCLMKGGRVPTGLFLALRRRLEERGWVIRIDDRRQAPRFHDIDAIAASLPQARPYQIELVRAMADAAGTGGLVLAATGTGKTFLAGLFLRALRETALFLVDELTLLEQTRRELAAVTGEEIGKVGEGVFDPRRITTATVQTISQSDRPGMQSWLGSVGVVIIDEVHLALNDRTRRAIARIHPLCVYGMTATLQVDQDPVLFEAASMCGPVIGTYEYERALESGHLCAGVLAAADYERDIDGKAASWAEQYEKCIVRSRTRNDFIEAIARLAVADGRRICILVSRIRHLKILQRRLADLPCETVYGEVDSRQRDAARLRMDGGATRIILANRVFEKGVNIRSLDTIIDATMGRNANAVRQRFGRGVRILQGKHELVYVDIGDVRQHESNRFASTTEARRSSLLRMNVPIIASVRFRQGQAADAARRFWDSIRSHIRRSS